MLASLMSSSLAPSRRAALFLALGAPLVVAAVVLSHNAFRATAPPAPSAARTRVGPDKARCVELAQRYAETWDRENRCSPEIECAAEKRGGAFYGLDGCARFGPRGVRTGEADAVAETWMKAGCAQDYEVCSGEPRAQCRAGRCIELPPPPVPIDWVRTEVPGVLSFFRPSSLVPRTVHPEDSIARVFEGERLYLTLDYGAYSWAPDKDAGDPYDRVLEETEEIIAGQRARLLWDEHRNVNRPDMSLSISRILHFAELPQNPRFLLMADRPRLTLIAECQRREDCKDADVIFRSLELR